MDGIVMKKYCIIVRYKEMLNGVTINYVTTQVVGAFISENSARAYNDAMYPSPEYNVIKPYYTVMN
jgi:hypothetical protein